MIDSAIQLSLPSGLESSTIASGNALAQQVSTSEWLGPLAPIAMSPFFGLCALSGIATYGPQWLQDRSALFGETSMLNNPALFWTMLALASITSLPRLTKVCKPVALAAENLETYSAIIILIVMRFMAQAEPALNAETGLAMTTQPLILSAGVVSFSADVMMSLFSAINVIVINAVKLFFEFVIWLVPFPTVDAAVEIANKTLCVGLLGLYAYSPIYATVLNLTLLALCALIFDWTRRRLRYFREMVAGPFLAWLLPRWYAQRGNSFNAFTESRQLGLPALTPVHVQRMSDNEFQVHGRLWLRRISTRLSTCSVVSVEGVLAQKLILTAADGTTLTLLHRRWVKADECCQRTPVMPQRTQTA
jgi:hypothetical protein